MATVALTLHVMVVILLSIVGALLIVMHWRFSQFKKTEQHFLIAADVLEKTIDRARDMVDAMRGDNGRIGEELEDNLREANRTLQDLKYEMDRAEKVLGAYDALDKTVVTRAVTQTAQTVKTAAQGAEKVSATAEAVLPENESKTRRTSFIEKILPGTTAAMKTPKPEKAEAKVYGDEAMKASLAAVAAAINAKPSQEETDTTVQGSPAQTENPRLNTRPFALSSQPLRTVSPKHSASLYKIAESHKYVETEKDEPTARSIRSESEEILRRALQGRL